MKRRTVIELLVFVFILVSCAYAYRTDTYISPVTITKTTDTTYTSAQVPLMRDSLLKWQWGGKSMGSRTLSLRVVVYFAGIPCDTLRLDSLTAQSSRFVSVKGDSLMNKWRGGWIDTNNTAWEIQKQMPGWTASTQIQIRGTSGSPLTWASKVTN